MNSCTLQPVMLMPQELTQFLSEFEDLSQADRDLLAQNLNVKAYRKNAILVNQGELCDLCFFVLRGCLRQFVTQDGVEKSIGFFTERQAVNFFTSFTQKTTATSSLQCLEDCVLIVSEPATDAKMFAEIPALGALTRKMVEADFGKTQDAFAKFITSSPEERYVNLLSEQPGLVKRVPQVHLASYLGITPESLSRIRKRLSQK